MTSRLQSSGIAALSFTLSAAVLAIALTPAVAVAATIIEPVELTETGDRLIQTRRVNAGDLDLTNAADLKLLDRRISRAIYQVCRAPDNGRATLVSGSCDFEARRSADQQVTALRSSATMLAAANGSSQARTITVVASR